MMFSSLQSINTRRIEAGILDSGSDFNTSMTLFEAGLDKFINLQKDGFIGKKALMNVARVNRIYGLMCYHLIPSRGDLIFDRNNEVGQVITGAHSPSLNSGIGYIRFHRPGKWFGQNLSICSINRGSGTCKIANLPFLIQKREFQGKPVNRSKCFLDGHRPTYFERVKKPDQEILKEMP